MTRFIAFLMPLLMMSAAYAQEAQEVVQEAAITEPNYIAIIIFFVISVGSCGWYMWKLLTQKEQKDEDAK